MMLAADVSISLFAVLLIRPLLGPGRKAADISNRKNWKRKRKFNIVSPFIILARFIFFVS